MPNYIQSLNNIRFGGGDLKVNFTDSLYSDSDFSKFVSLGGTERESGALLRFGEKSIRRIIRENDPEEPEVEWVDSQEVTFETTLLESTLENLALAIGADTRIVGDQASANPKYKFFRFSTQPTARRYPMMYVVPHEDSSLVTRLIMPSCEILGAVEVPFSDEKPRTLKIQLRLHRVLGTQTGELIQNPSFEQGGGTPTNWTLETTATWTVVGCTTAFLTGKVPDETTIQGCVHSGQQALLFTATGSSGTAKAKQMVSLEQGKTYQFSFWHYSLAPMVSFQLIFAGGATKTLQTAGEPFRWVRESYTFVHTGSTGVQEFSIAMHPDMRSVYLLIDDVECRVSDWTIGQGGRLDGKKFEIRQEYP